MSQRALSAGVLALVAACGGTRPPAPPAEPPGPAYRATVRWTAYDVPHVIADDLAGVGFGQGWAHAKQHLCRLADQFVRVRAERARYFGPGEDGANLDSDFFHLHLEIEARARALIASESDDAHDLARGWVAGYDHFVEHAPAADWPEACRGAAWVRPVDELDLARLAVSLATIASSRAFLPQIANAAPDGGTALVLPDPRDVGAASNGWALGADRTESGHGLLVANPHFPWEGDLTFSEIHLTARSDFDVYGAGIPGLPMVGIGFTRHHAWTHTFSSSTRFLLYRLRLKDGDPMTYLRDDGDGTARIVAHHYQIEVATPGGGTEKVERTLYSSPHGPMMSSAMTPWSAGDGTAWAFHDCALDAGGSAIDMYLGFARAESLDEFRAAVGERATPFLNTIYADVDGNAWYVDGSAVPDLSDDALAAWQVGLKAVPALAQSWQRGIAVVDGSSAMFDVLGDDPAAPGVIPLDVAPDLLRSDFVFNANDSYAMTNPGAPMSGYSPLYGAADATPSPRSLMNLRLLREPGVASSAGADGRFSRAEAQTALLSNRSFTGEQLRDEVLKRCRAEVTRRQKQKKKGAALEPLCTRLAEWDLRFGLASRGAVLWRELMQQVAVGGAIPWTIEFDAAAPSTPAGLAAAPRGQPDPLIAALERAADTLAAAGVDVRAGSPPLADLQHAAIGAQVAVPGGVALDGVANVVAWNDWNYTLLPRAARQPAISSSGLGPDGYPVNYGTSWVMAVELLPEGPQADVLMTYGPGDQLALFAAGTLRPARFDEAAIAADPDLRSEDVVQDER
jgi:acyl-homoserine-lactone acylase